MSAIFLPGPFARADMLEAIVGRPVARPTAAHLGGHALCAEPLGARLGLVDQPGTSVAGGVAEADREEAARLEFAFAAFGGPGRFVRVGDMMAFVLDSAPGAVLADDGSPEWRAHLVEAACEAMYFFGQRSAREMPRLMLGISYRALGRVRGAAGATPAAVRSAHSVAADVERITLRRPYSRYFAVEEHVLRHRRFDGGMSETLERAVFASGDAVTILPFDPRRQLVLLIEQFRVGPLARSDPSPWSLEAVAGRCDAGEGPEATARREALEEAGLALGRVERAMGYYSSPGVSSEHITAYVGEAALDDPKDGLHGLAAEDEDIRSVVVPLAGALALVDSGEINNAPLLLSLLWLQVHAERLTAAWTA